MNETYFEQLLQWLARCPALTGIDLRVDDLPPAAGTGALFPKGVEQTDRWQNLLGQVTARQKMQLVLRLNLPFVPGDANLSAQTARRLLELQAWVAEQSAAGFAPQLGNADPVQETLTAGAARLEQANDEGSAVYTVTLTAHYTMKWSDTFEDLAQIYGALFERGVWFRYRQLLPLGQRPGRIFPGTFRQCGKEK